MTVEKIGVLIAGGGPVGATLAMDLGWRNVPCLVVERVPGPPTNPRCNTTAARSMEHYRRLGVADRIRASGLPDDAPTDVVYRTRRVGGYEILRYELPSAAFVRSGYGGAEGDVTPEPQHRIGQIFLEPILLDHAASFDCVEIRRGVELVGFEQREDCVRAEIKDVESGETHTVEADYLIGCDGGSSTVRRRLGIPLNGVPEITKVVSHYFRSPELAEIVEKPAWLAWSVNPDGISNLMAVDGRELWINHSLFPLGTDTESLDPAELLVRTVGQPVAHEQLGVARWTGKALVADHYRDGRVFLAGDAAHIWIPMAGFGMNSGIQDATNLAWMLAAVHEGWAGPGLLDAYESERRPVGDQVAKAASAIAGGLSSVTDLEASEDASEDGAAVRDALADAIRRADRQQYNPVGLSFGYHYAESPVIAKDGDPPPFTVNTYEPTTIPGCRLPHYWRRPGVSVFDELGPFFTLLRVGPDAPEGRRLVRAAAEAGVPIEVLSLPEQEAVELYEAPLVLVRPDQHVAWRGAVEPAEPEAIIERVRGAGAASATLPAHDELQEVAS